MNTFNAIWKKLGKSKRYREQFVADHAKRAIPHQARAIMKARGWSQQGLAKNADLSQGVVSRAVDPSYGNLTLNTIIRIAAGFDVAFIGRFVPFSELARWYRDLPRQDFDIPRFDVEDAARAAHDEAVADSNVVEITEGGEGGFEGGDVLPAITATSGEAASRQNEVKEGTPVVGPGLSLPVVPEKRSIRTATGQAVLDLIASSETDKKSTAVEA